MTATPWYSTATQSRSRRHRTAGSSSSIADDGWPVSTVRLITPGASDDIRVQLEDQPLDGSAAYRVIAHDLALVPGEHLGTLYVADQDGNQAFAFELR